MSLFQVAFPGCVWAITKLHYAITSKDFSKQTTSLLLLIWLLVCFSCIASLVFSLRGTGWKRVAGAVCSISAGVLNLFFLALSSLV